MKCVRLLTAGFVLVSAPLRAQDVVINHKPVGCVVAGKLPRLESGFEPAAAVAQARVYFRAGGTPNWYFVPMARDGKSFQGVLPKPLESTKTIEYYIETLDAAVNSSRTSEYSAQVVSDPGACSKKLLVATVAAAAKVAVGLPAGASGLSLVPAGFTADGIVAAGAAGAAGATSAAGSGGAGVGTAGAAAGGGIGATALVLGGVAVAGAAAAVVVSHKGGTDSSQPGANNGPARTSYRVAFSPGIDVSVCGGPSLGWLSQGLLVDAQGNFNEVWSPDQPNTLRVTGQLTATTLNATLSCARTGTPTGSMSATGSGGSYSGTFDFAGSRGTIQVTKTS